MNMPENLLGSLCACGSTGPVTDLLHAAADPDPDGPPPREDGDPGLAGTAAEPPPSKLRRCDMTKLYSAALKAPTFIVEPLIPRGYLTLFGGHGGSGKSALGLVFGAHVTCGRTWAGLSVVRGRVLFVSLEDDEDLVFWRLRGIAEEYALNLAEIIAGLTVIDATAAAAIMFESSEFGIKKVLPTADGEELQAMVGAERYDLVIIDNASDAFDGDENNRRQVRSFVRYCAGSVKPHNGAVLLLAHIDKNAARYGAGKNSYSGSTGWHNSARSRLALADDELRQEKLNVGKALEIPIPIAWTPRAVPVPAGQGGAVAAQAAAYAADDASLLECFKAAAQAGQSVPSAATGPATTWHILSAYAELAKPLKDNKTRFREGIVRLLRTGEIRAESYRSDNRKPKERLILSRSADAPVCASSEPAQNWREPTPLCASSQHRGVGIGAAHPPGPTELAQDPQTGPATDDMVAV